MTGRRRWGIAVGIVAALVLGTAGASAPPARADLLSGICLPGTPAPSLSEALSCGPGNLVEALACPLAGLLPPAPVVTQLSAVACALGTLDYAYVTVYTRPDHTQLRRITHAIAEVPTPIDVNGDGIPDFTGTLGVSINPLGITLDISRILDSSAGLPVSIEAVANSPAAGRSFVGLGYDGTAAGTPQTFAANLSLVSLTSGNAEVAVTITTTKAPAALSAIAEQFQGNPDAPANRERGALAFAPVPASLGADLKLQTNRDEVAITSSTPSVVKPSLALIGPGEEQDLDGVIDKLPASADVVYDRTGGHSTVNYTASAPVGHLGVTYRDHVGTSIASAAALDALGLPRHVTADQQGSRTSVTAGAGEAIGSVEARYGSGADVPAAGPGTGPYLAYHQTATATTAAARIVDLHALAVDAAPPYQADLQLTAPLPHVDLSAVEDPAGLTVTGGLSGLPAHTTYTADPGHGVASFDGHGSGIGEIALHATKTTPFFTRTTRIDATVDGVPSPETVHFQQTGGTLTASASAPLGTISLLASDGVGAPGVAGSYAWYVDTPAIYQAFVRIAGLSGLSFGGSPAAGSIDAGRQVLNLHAQTSGATFDGSIDQLPAHVGFGLTPGAGGSQALDYAASDRIDRITLDATGLRLPLGATHLHTEIDGLPGHMTLTIPGRGGTIAFDPHGARVGRVLAQVYGVAGPVSGTASHQLLAYDEPNGRLTVDLHRVGPFSAGESTSPLHVQYDVAADPLDFAVGLSGGHYITGTISNPEPATVDVNPAGGDLVVDYHVNPAGSNFTGTGQIDRIDVATDAGGGYLEGHLTNVPANLHICEQSSTGTTCKPGWIPSSVGGRGVPDPSFAIQLLPTDLSGGVPTNRLTFNGVFCPSEPDPGHCTSGDDRPARVVVSDLAFNTVEAGFGSADDHCHIACGRVWGAFDTRSEPLTGDVRYIGHGDTDPTFEYRATTPGSYLATNRKFVFVHYDAVSFTPVEIFSSGSLTCGRPKPFIGVTVAGFGLDLGGGTFGLCP